MKASLHFMIYFVSFWSHLLPVIFSIVFFYGPQIWNKVNWIGNWNDFFPLVTMARNLKIEIHIFTTKRRRRADKSIQRHLSFCPSKNKNVLKFWPSTIAPPPITAQLENTCRVRCVDALKNSDDYWFSFGCYR